MPLPSRPTPGLAGLMRAVPQQSPRSGFSSFQGMEGLLPDRSEPDLTFGDVNPTVDPDPALMLDFLQGQRIDETRDRLFNAERAPSPDSSISAPALKGLLKRQEGDREGSFINSIQAPQIEAIREANLGAAMEGFGDPQEQAFYRRSIAEEKMRQPLEEARLRGQTAINQAEAQTRGQVNLQNQMHRNFMDQLRLQSQLGGQPITRTSQTRTGNSVSFAAPPAPTVPKAMAGAAGLIDDLPRLRYLAEQGDPGAVAAYQTAKANALATRTDWSIDVRQAASDAADFPAFKGLNPAQIIQELQSGKYGDVSQTLPQEWFQLQEALNLLVGATPLSQ